MKNVKKAVLAACIASCLMSVSWAQEVSKASVARPASDEVTNANPADDLLTVFNNAQVSVAYTAADPNKAVIVITGIRALDQAQTLIGSPASDIRGIKSETYFTDLAKYYVNNDVKTDPGKLVRVAIVGSSGQKDELDLRAHNGAGWKDASEKTVSAHNGAGWKDASEKTVSAHNGAGWKDASGKTVSEQSAAWRRPHLAASQLYTINDVKFDKKAGTVNLTATRLASGSDRVVRVTSAEGKAIVLFDANHGYFRPKNGKPWF